MVMWNMAQGSQSHWVSGADGCQSQAWNLLRARPAVTGRYQQIAHVWVGQELMGEAFY